MDLRHLQHTHRGEHSYCYEGIPMYCAYGIHEQSFRIVQELDLRKDSEILILGAGAGAFDKRLQDNGFTRITAIEYTEGTYKVEGTRLLSLDLNEDFSHVGTFKLIIALEIIEHLENHFHFIREIKKCLDVGGYVIVSTPNVESSFARIKYFLSGKLHFFTEELALTGHITPVFRNIFDFNLAQSELQIDKVVGNESLWWRLIGQYDSYIMRVVYFFLYTISWLEHKKTTEHNNNINIFLISHNEQKLD